MPQDLRDAIADELARFPAGVTIQELGRKLGKQRVAQISELLTEMQGRRLVRHTGARWQWIGSPRRRPTTTPTAKSPAPPPLPPPPQTTPDDQPDPVAPPANQARGSRWDTFRRLCLYYSEFVRLEERAAIKVFANGENTDFVQVPGAIDWRGLEAGEAIVVHLPIDSQVFVRRGASGNKLPYWFLGLPIDVFRGHNDADGKDWVKLQPIFVIPVRPEVRDDTKVVLEPLGPIEVNPGWLQQRFKRADQRMEFLATVGLDEAADADRDGDGEARYRVTTFRAAIDAVRIAYKSWWREFPSIDGLQVSPPLQDLRDAGLHNRALLVSQPRLKYAHRLFKELLELADPSRVTDADLDRTALTALFPHEPPPSSKAAAAVEQELHAEYALLNEEQRQAIEAALRHRLTVLTGPPGTGKSVTVANVMANMALRRRSVLFASRNHQAIEAVEPKLNAIVEPETLVMRPSRPYGQASQIADWKKALIELLTKPRDAGSAAALQTARTFLDQVVRRRADTEASMRELLDLTDEFARLEQQATAAADAVAPSLRAAIGPHVGIPTAEDLDALVAELRAADCTRLPWLRRWLTKLRRWIERRFGRDRERDLRGRAQAIADTLANRTAGVAALAIDSSTPLASIADRLAAVQPFLTACDAARRRDDGRQRITAIPTRDELDQQLADATEQLHTATESALRLVAEVSGTEIPPATRQKFAELRAGLENHQGTAGQEKFERGFAAALPDLLRHYPLWAVSNLSAYKAMPLAAGVADLLIVDEASQCDIPSVVPLLFRAKRALIVGDPMQLGHISSMSRQAEMRIRQKYDLVGPTELERFTVGVNSIYDLAASSARRDAMVQLRAHYRCHPHIASYCNRAFYNGTLRVMTNVRRLKRLPGIGGTARACEWTHVEGEIVAATNGCHSPAQVQAVLQQLQRLADAGFDGSVGVVTPFRVQANRIQDAVSARFAAEQTDRWQFLAHTVDGFQGDERDVILFSLVAGAGMPAGSRSFLGNAPNRFNVAISRARSFVRILGDRNWALSCGIPHITELVRICDDPAPGYAPRPELIGPVWEPKLAAALRTAGIDIRQQYPACGYYLDFALVSEDLRLDVEVDGETWHRGSGGQRHVDDLYRDHVLKSAGWQVLRFWVYELREDLDGCVNRIRSTWKRLGGPA